MIESISTAVTAQTNTAGSVKAAETSESQKAAEQSAVQTNDDRKYDRFVSSEVLRYGSPDDPQARKAFDKMHNAAKTVES